MILPSYLILIVMISFSLMGLFIYKKLVIGSVYKEISKYFEKESDDYKNIIDGVDIIINNDNQNKLLNGFNIMIILFSALFMLIFFLDYIFNLYGMDKLNKIAILVVVSLSLTFMIMLINLNASQLKEDNLIVNVKNMAMGELGGIKNGLSEIIGIIFVYLVVVGIVFKRGLLGVWKIGSDITLFNSYKFYNQIFFIIFIVVVAQGILFVFKQRTEISKKIVEEYGERVVYTINKPVTKDGITTDEKITIDNLNTNIDHVNNNNYYNVFYVLLVTLVIIYYFLNHFGNDRFNILTSLNKISEYTGYPNKIKYALKNNSTIFSMLLILISLGIFG
jgi:hypothetical protein